MLTSRGGDFLKRVESLCFLHILQTWKERRDIDENGNNSHRDRGDPCVRTEGIRQTHEG